MNKLSSGTFIVRSKLMGYCAECGKLVQINKTIFGDLHFCLTEEEIKEKYNGQKNK